MLKLFIALCILFSSLFALDGKVIRVVDGDTITILTNDKAQIKIRLHGIDAPEKKQAYGQKSKEFLSSMIAGKNVRIDKKTTDRYGRTIGVVYLGNIDINEQVVLNGYAWAYTRYSKNYKPQENKARSKRLGLWQDSNPIKPEDFRKAMREK